MKTSRTTLLIIIFISAISACDNHTELKLERGLSMEENEDRFQHCIAPILLHEGGLSNDPEDPGGITQWGISLRYLRSIGYDVDKDGDIDAQDILELNQMSAIAIYRKYWWNAYHYADFRDLIVVEKVFDLAVNMGGKGAHKLLQIAINRLNEKAITVDGILGDQTMAAANTTDGILLREQLRQCARHRYIEILAAHPHMEVFRNGWLRRAAW